MMSTFLIRNNQAVLLSGFRRGGTNIAWNLLQSHPTITSPIYELGELHWRSRWLRWGLDQDRTLLKQIGRIAVARALFQWKMATLEHPDNRYSAPDRVYTPRQVANTILCIKAVDREVCFAHRLSQVYSDLRVIGLARHGHALCDGHLRRGGSIEDLANTYATVASEFEKLRAQNVPLMLMRFEDILADPFEAAKAMFEFLNVSPAELPLIRLKSKRVLKIDGSHDAAFGAENEKRWFDRNQIVEVIDPRINTTQRSRLTAEQKAAFDAIAGDAMALFGYE